MAMMVDRAPAARAGLMEVRAVWVRCWAVRTAHPAAAGKDRAEATALLRDIATEMAIPAAVVDLTALVRTAGVMAP